MESKDLVNGKNHAGNGKESVVKEVEASPMERKAGPESEPVDIMWVKNRGGSWWPAQVVDENLVSENRKPSKQSAGKVLVRLYGTYTYSYVDPIKWRSEFDTILEQNNGSYREVLLEALLRDVVRLRAGKSKRQRSKSKGNTEDKTEQPNKDVAQKKGKPNSRSTKSGNQDTSEKNSKRNTEGEKRKNNQDGNLRPKHNEVLKKRNRNSSGLETCTKPQELSSRRLKVMQNLGLAAPPGSPFCRSGQA